MTPPAYLSVAQQVTILFAQSLSPLGSPYSMQEISAGTGLSLGSLSQLRTGRIQNPQLTTLRALSAFFSVPLRYFQTRSAEECYALLRQSPEEMPGTLSEIALRVSTLPPEAQQDILTVIQWVQAAADATRSGGERSELPRLNQS